MFGRYDAGLPSRTSVFLACASVSIRCSRADGSVLVEDFGRCGIEGGNSRKRQRKDRSV